MSDQYNNEKPINIQPDPRSLQDYLAQEYLEPPPLPTLVNLLKPLLSALNWQGSPNQLAEALPHIEPVEKINELRSVLYHLNYYTKPFNHSPNSLRKTDFPCLFENEKGQVFVLLSYEGDHKYNAIGSVSPQRRIIDLNKCDGVLYLIEPINLEMSEKEIEKNGWVRQLIKTFRSQFLKLFLLTFIIGLLSLALPIYVISIYDNVIGTNSAKTLGYAIIGMGLIIGLEFILRTVRLKLISYIGARIEYLLVRKAFLHILKLPIAAIRAAPIGAQITRIKQFESITSIFTGTLADAFLDIPLLMIFIAISFIIGGTLGWVSVGLIIIYTIIGLATIRSVRYQVAETGETKSKSRNFLLETLSKHRSLFYNGSLDVWTRRYGEHWSRYRHNQFISNNTNLILHTVSQTLVVLAVIIILTLGAQGVIEETLSLGSLIALMIIIWRILSPIQKIYLGFHKIGQVSESLRQIDILTKLKPEEKVRNAETWHRKFNGNFILSNIALRYHPEQDPVLRNITFKVDAGEMVAISGPTGSGKSTLLRVLLGLYQPQLGVVQLDNLDLRQIDLSELRHSISYAPQTVDFFYGSIKQNLELSDANATPEDIEHVLRELRLWDEIQKFPKGINMRLKSKSKYHLSSAIRQQLNLARALLKQRNIYLLDTPTNNLGPHAREGLIEKLKSLKGKSTILMVTHDKDLLMLADRVLVMSRGIIVADKAPDELIKIAG